MSIARKIAHDTTLFVVCKVSGTVVSSISFFIIARYLGKHGLGQYSIVFAYLSFFQILTGLGIDTIMIRELSHRSNQEAIIGNAILLKVSSGAVAVIASWVTVHALGYEQDVRFYIYIASLSLLFGFNTTISSLFQHRMKATYYLLPDTIISIASSLFMVFLAFRGASIFYLITVNALSIVPISISYYLICTRMLQFNPSFIPDVSVMKNLLQSSWPILLSSIFNSINTRIDQLILYGLQGDTELGIYSAVVKLAESMNIIPVAFATVIYPVMCDSYNKSPESFELIYRKAFKYMSILAWPIAVGTTILSDKIIFGIYGNTFGSGIPILSILIWTEIFIFLGCINGNVLVIMNLQKLIFVLTLIGALSNISLNFLLIPKYSGIGAAITSVISYSVVGLLPQVIIKKTRSLTFEYLKSMAMPMVCSAIMGILVYNMRNYNAILVVLAGAVFYFATLFLFRHIDATDIVYAKEVFGRKR